MTVDGFHTCHSSCSPTLEHCRHHHRCRCSDTFHRRPHRRPHPGLGYGPRKPGQGCSFVAALQRVGNQPLSVQVRLGTACAQHMAALRQMHSGAGI